MAPPLLDFMVASLPDHCEPTSPFLVAISSNLHICLPTPLALVSTTLGTLSIVSWLFAQMPQIYKNYQLKSTSGLSLFFLVIWCLGDVSNLLGAQFTRQAGWQVVVACYYVFVDLILVIQYFWYTHYKAGQYEGYKSLSHLSDPDARCGVLQGVPLPDDNSTYERPAPVDMTKPTDAKDISDRNQLTSHSSPGHLASYSNEKKAARMVRLGTSASSPPFALPRTMLIASLLCAVLANAAPTEAPPSHPPISHVSREAILEIVGRIFSWMSTILYLGSRPPQLYKNYQRKSTEGLSPLLFMAAFCGNFFYSTSLITNPNAWSDMSPYGGGGWADSHGNDRWEWIGRSLPFFLGAFGVLGLDGFMGVQFLMYGSPEEDDVSIESEDGDSKHGPTHWRRVHGWMRGWIPSTAQYERVPESQALLGADQGRYGTV